MDMDGNGETHSRKRNTKWMLGLCAAAWLTVLAGAFLFATPFWQLGYRTVASTPFQVQEMFRVELNSADAAALCSLPGIGEKKAQAILRYREEHGPFQSLEELEQVEGISRKNVESWQDRLYIQPENTAK